MLRIQFIGHIGKDAVVRTLEGGSTVINFNVAHTEKYRNKNNELIEKTTWISCSYWAKSTAIAQYLTKGKQVYVEGKPEVDVYNSTGRNAEGIVGQQKCIVSSVQLLGGRDGGSQPAQQQPSSSGNRIPDASEITEPIDDLPF